MDVRLITEDEVDAYQHLLESSFGADPDPEELAWWRPLVEPDRTHGVFDGGTLVGSAAVFTFDMTVPGGPRPCGGVTGVSVAPTHRRQGALTSLMRAQLDAIRDLGRESFASLWASEPVIYHRFGYGVASRRWNLTVEGHDPALLGRAPEGRVRQTDLVEMRKLAPPLYDALRAERTGMISRSGQRWDTRIADLPGNRRGGSAIRNAVYERDGEPRGYAWYRVKGDWTEGRPKGQVMVKELVALDADAHGGLWRFLLGIDLMRSVSWDNVPADDPIHGRLRDVRSIHARSIVDGLWVRIMDVPRALTERSYATSASVTIEVTDDLGYAAGRWTLDASPDGATCEPTTASADVAVSAEELGAVYLGETTLASLHAAGRVDEHTPGAVRQASALFAWPVAPWCPEIF